MFHAFELRFVVMLTIMLSQAILSLLSLANIMIAPLTGTFVMLPVFIIATNAPMCIAILVLIILESRKKSPIGIQSEVILCAAASGIELVCAVAILFFAMSDTICGISSRPSVWNACGAHFAIVVLLWTVTFLLLSYAIGLFYTARRYNTLHPLAEESVWKKTVNGTPWTRQAYSFDNPPGRRLRKKGPLDIESLHRVVKDEDSQPLSRQTGHASTSSLASVVPSRPLVRPPGLDSPIGFAEQMGYFRRDVQGEYVVSTPTSSRETLPANPHRKRSNETERGAAFTVQAAKTRRPSYPDLPNPFPPRPATQPPNLRSSLDQLSVPLAIRSQLSLNSSARSSNESDPGFAGVGAGASPQKDGLRISVPMPFMSPGRGSLGPPSARSARTPTGNQLLGGAHSRPFHVSAPMTPTSVHSVNVPRISFQSSRSGSTPTPFHFRQAGPRPGYSYTHQHSQSHPPLVATTAMAPTYNHDPTVSSHNRPRSHSASSEPARPRPAFLQVPPAVMSPSTRQRVSNAAYPLPLPPLSTYPIKSIAMSAEHKTSPAQMGSTLGEISAANDTPIHAPTEEKPSKDRPLSTVSSVSIYSTSSASHAPPPREVLASLSALALPSENHPGAQRSNSSASRRASRSKKTPTVFRGPSQYGITPQNRWGGTGNGHARRSLAAQFHQPQPECVRRN